VLCYAAYLAVAGALFWRLTRKPPQAPRTSTLASTPADVATERA